MTNIPLYALGGWLSGKSPQKPLDHAPLPSPHRLSTFNKKNQAPDERLA